MKKPPYQPQSKSKPALLWKASFARLYQLFKDPSSLRPAAGSSQLPASGGQPLKRPLPRLKGNVYHTMKELLRLFMGAWKQATRPLNPSVRTTYSSLAQCCRNLDQKTAYLHVLTLLEHGFLRAKVRLSHGIQLLLHPDLLVFDTTGAQAPVVPLTHVPAASPPRGGAQVPAPGVAPYPKLGDANAALRQLSDKLSVNSSTFSARRFSSDLIGEKPRH